MRLDRSPGNPIIRPHMDGRMGAAIGGPSLVTAPPWVERPLGRYYLYFSAPRGTYLRLAVADTPGGPWRTHEAGVLELEASGFDRWVAMPDVHVDRSRREVLLYCSGEDADGVERVRVLRSVDGLAFEPAGDAFEASAPRAVRWRDHTYVLGRRGTFHRSADGRTAFERGPVLFTPAMRNAAVRLHGDALWVFYSNVGDRPERILFSVIDLRPDWRAWRATIPVNIVEPEHPLEGVDLPLERSQPGPAPGPVRQLRDPALFEDGDGRLHLLYAVAGEGGIAIAAL